jgi:adenylate cyclase
VTEGSVPLESILPCLEGVIPSPIATCSAEGTPNITYLSIVHYVDSERVALSRQFFSKTRANLDVNPRAQVRIVEPDTFQQYALDLYYLHTETEGSIFDAMKANLDAVASQQGMGDVFRLRGVDIHRVVRCAPVGDRVHAGLHREPERDVIGPLDEFMRRVALCDEYGAATRTALQALDDAFGFGQAILLIADGRGERLFAVASNGYPTSSAGAEVPFGVGLIGVAAERRRVVCVPNLARSRAMRTGVRESLEQRGEELPGLQIPLPGLESAQSAAAVPLVVHGVVAGVLYLESDQPGRFGPHNERVLRVLGGHLATALAVLEATALAAVEAERHESALSAPPPARPGDAARVSYYQADDSVFVDGEYLIKGVPGRILWKLLSEHVAEGRTAFTNRELRLDERLGLPFGNDNLEARLLVLRKRLAGRDCGIQLERVGRGQLALHVARPLVLSEVTTSGPMRAAHAPPETIE